MPERYIEVDRTQFENFLSSKGFSQSIVNKEIVYSRPHADNQNLFVRVYTSISTDNSVARTVGSDAIRVVCVLDNGIKSYGIGKFPRVYRTGSQESVHARTYERILSAFQRCDEWLKEREGSYIGNVGDELRRTVSVVGRKPYNNKFLFTMNDENKNVLTYWSVRDLLQVGEMYDIKFFVKRHHTFQNKKQTEIDNVVGRRIIQ